MACIKKTAYGYRCDWRDKQGNRYRRTFDLKKDAEDFLSRIKVDIKDGKYLTAKTAPLFREVAEQWFENKRNRRPSTLVAWRTHLDRHLLPVFGDLRLSEIDVNTVEARRNAWLDQKPTHGRVITAPTVNKLLVTLSSIFDFARRRKQCVDNAARDAERVRTGNGEITTQTAERRDGNAVSPNEVLNPEELRQLIDHAEAGYYRTLIMAVAFTGARHDELLAWQWNDIDLNAGSVRICRSLTWARLPGEDKRPRFYPPKTKAGLRTIALAPELVHALKVWKLQCPPSPDGLVFPTPEGTPMYRGNVLRDGLYPALRRAGLRRVDMHSLRHSFASCLIIQGASVTEVQHYLGHSSPTTTLRVYAHWFSQVKTDSLQRLAKSVLAGNWTPNGHQTPSEAIEKAISA